jgi:hypothetical protein
MDEVKGRACSTHGENRNAYLEDLDVDGRIILRRFLEEWDGVEWTGLIYLRLGISDRRL